jgi:3-deoxy-7-phosphoheptulonate synthase
MVDASHGNSQKKPENQIPVIGNIAEQLAAGERRIFGVMIESNIVGGRQDLEGGQPLTYGQSVTDGCVGWDETVGMFETLAEAIGARRSAIAA